MLQEMCLTTSDKDEWRSYLPAKRSVFGSLEYARICETFRGCLPRLYVLKSELSTICHPMLFRPISNLPFAPEGEGKWDSTTPDYTGPLVEGDDPDLMARFRNRLRAFAREKGIIAEFAHLHPWSVGLNLLREDCSHNRDIVWVDVALPPDTLFREHFEHSCRKNIKKAQREGVNIVVRADDDAINEFYRIYCDTMRRNHALDKYYFSLDFFKRIRDDLSDHARFVFAEHSKKVIAATLYMHDDNDVFSFLGGTDANFNALRPTNVAIWETIRWAHGAGKKRLILGSGYRPNDGISRFKGTFSPLRKPFYVYKRIHRQNDFAILDQCSREYNGLGDENVDYFPSYRYVKDKTLANQTCRAAPNQPFPAWPYFAQDEIAAATEVLRSGKVNYWTGQQGRQFENEFAQFAECKYAVAVANGTVALELALRALGIGPGDEVITTSRTFIATASAVIAVGARPVFADVDRESQNITAETISAVVSARTRAIIAVHLAGMPCDMDPILELARRSGLYVIEDCAQAHGARYKGRPVGSMGDIAAFSFCQDKIMTTAGEGGMVTTNSEALWGDMWAYKDHGKSFEAVYAQTDAPGFRWLHESFGTNWRLSEVQSAVGRVELKKVPQWIAIRRNHAKYLTERWSKLRALRIPRVPDFVDHSFYKFYAFVRSEELLPGWSRDRIIEEISAKGIFCASGICSEVYLEKAFPQEMRPSQRLAVARELGETSLMFLVHPTMERRHMERTAQAVEETISRATAAGTREDTAELTTANV